MYLIGGREQKSCSVIDLNNYLQTIRSGCLLLLFNNISTDPNDPQEKLIDIKKFYNKISFEASRRTNISNPKY